MATDITPSYISEKNENSVSRVLSRLNFTSQRDVDSFRTLCEYGEAIIPYKQVLTLLNMQSEEFALVNLFTRLTQNNLGILRNKIIEEKLVPDYLLLCDEGSKLFYAEYISEEVLKCLANPENPLVTFSSLTSAGKDLQKSNFLPLTPEKILSALKNKNEKMYDQDDVYLIPISSQDEFLCTTETIPHLGKSLINRLRGIFNDSKVSQAIVGILDLSMTDFMATISSNDMPAWSAIIDAIHREIATVEVSPLVQANHDIIDYAIILHAILPMELQNIKDEETTQENSKKLQHNILSRIEQHDNGVSESELHNIIETSIEDFDIEKNENDKIHENFINDHVVQPNHVNSKNLLNTPVCIKIGNTYIHSNKVITALGERIYELSNTLKEYYKNSLDLYLMGKLPAKDNVFINIETLELSVHQMVNEMDPLYSNILKFPALIANILTMKKWPDVAINTPLAGLSPPKRLAIFFNFRSKEYLQWHEIFGIRLSTFINESYSKFSFFKKLWLIFSGRYGQVLGKIEKIQRSQVYLLEGQTKSNAAKINKIKGPAGREGQKISAGIITSNKKSQKASTKSGKTIAPGTN